MSTDVSMKRKSISAQFFKRTGSLLSGAARDYISHAMPNITDTASDVRAEAAAIRANVTGVTQNLKRIKNSTSFKSIFDWYMGTADSFMSESAMPYDIPDDNDNTDNNESSGNQQQLSAAFVNTSNANTNKLAAAIVNSSMKLAEAQVTSTANITTAVQNLQAEVGAGFKRTNKYLAAILEVLTKNTAALIDTNLAMLGNQQQSATDSMLQNGKFSLGNYKKVVMENLSKDPIFGTAFALLPMVKTLGSNASPEELMSTVFGNVMDKLMPNFEKSLSNIDTAIADGVMKALIGVGNNARSGGIKGMLARLFGIDASRRGVDTANAQLELKRVAFDSVTREAIVGAIPGYLRKILVAVGGKDEVYDYRSRKFTTRSSIRTEFQKASAYTGGLDRASAAAKKTFGNDEFGQMLYDLMLADMGGAQGSKYSMNTRRQALSNQDSAVKYMTRLLGGGRITNADMKRLQQIATNLSYTDKTGVVSDMEFQAAKRNVNRRSDLQKYVYEQQAYGIDLSGFTDTVRNELAAIRKTYGRTPDYGQAEATTKNSLIPGKGLNYTNFALYSIFKRLDTGLNVYVTGMGNQLDEPYPSMNDYLPKPEGMRTKTIKIPQKSSLVSGAAPSINTDENELLKGTDEEGNPLTAGERLTNWGKRRGKQIWNGLRAGDSQAVYAAINDAFSDVTGLAASKAKEGIQKLNDSFGNVAGYLRHKITGKGYSYMDGDREVFVKDNESGGILGVLKDEFTESFKNVKDKASNWFSRVSSYFNYGEDDKKEGSDVVSKRKKFIAASVGALAGAGLLGGPIGLIMGAVAGNALSGFDIKGKITKMLFGYDEDEEGNSKPTGIVSRFADAFITPIKFQLSKTLTKGAKVIEKKIIGPLSDIGFAIKERMAKAADDTFGRAFRFIGGVITAPFKLLKKGFNKAITGIFQGITSMFGSTARGTMDAAGWVAGGIGNKVVNNSAPNKEGRQALKERRRERNKRIDDEFNDPNNIMNMKFSDYRQRERNKMSKRIKRLSSEEVTAEQFMTEEEIKKQSQDINENTAAMKESQEKVQEDIAELTEHALTTDGKHSIFTHDEGIHRYLERIIDIISGEGDHGTRPINNKMKEGSPELSRGPKPGKKLSKKELEAVDITDADDFANAIVSGISAIGSANGSFTSEEAELVKKATMESSKNNSDRDSMEEYMIKMINEQGEKGDAEVQEKEEEESWISKLLGGLGDSLLGGLGKLLPWLLGALGLGALLKVDWGSLLSGIGDTLSNIGKGFSDLLAFFGIGNGKPKGQDATDAGVNTVLSPFDTNVDSAWDFAIPGADLYHVQTDGAGNNVRNSAATHAKDEVLYLHNLRKEVVSGPAANQFMANWKMGKATKYADKADQYQAKADAYKTGGSSRGGGARRNQRLADKYRNKSNKALEEAAEYELKNEDLRGSTAAGIVKQAGRVGVMKAAGAGANFLGSSIASAVGANEEQAEVAGNVAETAVSGGLMINSMKASAKGKESLIDKIINLFTNAMEFVGDKLKSNKKIAKIADKVDNIIDKLIAAVDIKSFTDDIVGKILTKLGFSATNQAIGAATLGIGIAVGGVAGMISGFCGTEHLFGVLPGEADALMTTISTVLTGVFGALEMVPGFGTICLIIDILDAVVAGVLETGIRQFLAQSLYRVLGGDANLDEKQAAFSEELNYYNETYGASMTSAAFNDMINNTGFWDQLWHGKTQYTEDGHLKFDDAGGEISNGMQQWFVGGEKKYVKDEEGNVVRKADGTAVQAVDKYGNKLMEDEKWGNQVGKFFSGIGRWFTGGDIYKTDDEGVAVVDENGEFIVEGKEKNIFGKIGDWFSGIKESVSDFGEEVKAGLTEEPEEAEKKGGVAGFISSGLSAIKSVFTAPARAVSELLGSDEANTEYDIGDDGEIIEKKSESGRSTNGGGAGRRKKTGGIGNLVSNAFNKLKSLFLGPSEAVSDTLQLKDKEQYEKGDDGKTIEITSADGKKKTKLKTGEYGAFMKTGLNTLNTGMTTPITEMTEALADWQKKDAPWLKGKEKAKTVGDWVTNMLNSFWKTLTGDVEDFTEGGSAGSTGAGRGGRGGPDLKKFGIGGPGKVNRTFSNTRHNPTGYKFGIGAPIDSNGNVQPYSASNPYSGSLSRNYGSSKQGGNPLSKEYTVTSGFQTPDRPDHNGIDIAPVDGSGEAQITATYEGKVRLFERNVPDNTDATGTTIGNYVTLDVTNPGRYGPDVIKYFHMKYHSLPSGIYEGATVHVGDKIGDMGNTGQSTGPHLHYQFERYDANGNSIPFNPLSDIQGNPGANPPSGSSEAYEDGEFNGTENKEYSGPLAELLAKLSELGTNFMNQITLGLFGNSSSSSDSSSSSTDYSFNYNADVMTREKFLQICENEVGQTDSPKGSNDVKYNTWYYGTSVESFDGDNYNWDTTFVQWCFNEAGYPLEYKTGKAKNLLTNYKRNMPDKIVDDPQPGDIAVINDKNTRRIVSGIIYNTSGGSISVYQGDSHNAVERVTYDKSRVEGYIRPVDWDAIAAYPEEGDIGSLFNYLKAMGFDNEAAAGILGNWSHESGNTPMSVESNYLQDFKNTYGDMNDPASYAKVAADIPKYSEYSKRVIQGLLNEGISLNVPYYTASDGYTYAGLGYAGWTGERAKRLLEFSKKQGMPWYTSAAQLSFANWEMSDSSSDLGPNGTNVKGKVMAESTPYNAAYTFNKWYEGIPWQEKRGTSAISIYNKYGKGGPGFNAKEYIATHGSSAYGIGGPSPDKEHIADGSKVGIKGYTQSSSIQNVINHSKKVKTEKTNPKLGHGKKVVKNGKEFGLGGPDLISSGTGTETVTGTAYRVRHTPKRFTVNTSTGYNTIPYDPSPATSTKVIANGTDLTTVTHLLHSAVQYLQAITTNTGSSVTYLDSLNNKEFIDKGLRDTITAAGQAKGKKLNNNTNGSSKIVKQLAHP